MQEKKFGAPLSKQGCVKAFNLLLLCSAFLLLFKPLAGQSLLLKHYTIGDGLAPGRINCIFQDSRGFLWFGAENGLSRFDGLRFENIYKGEDFSSDYIWDAYETPEGDIWFCTIYGGAVRYRSGSFKNYTTKDGLAHNSVFGMARGRGGFLWFATLNGLNRWDGQTFTNDTNRLGLPDNRLTSIVCDKEGNIWFGAWNGLHRLAGDRVTTYTTADGLPGNTITALTADNRGGLWIGTTQGLCRQLGKTFTCYTTRDGLAGNHIYRIAVDKTGTAWIGTKKGLSRFSGGTFTNFTTEDGLAGDNVLSLFHDREGYLWLGTMKGVTRINSFDNVIFSSKDGLGHNSVTAILQDKKGNYWFGTQRGAGTYNGKTFRHYSSADGLMGESVIDVKEDSGGNIWIACKKGLNMFSSKGIRNYSTRHGLPSHIITALDEDRDGNIWVGTNRGLCKSRKGTGSFTPLKIKEAAFEIHTLFGDKEGNVWFSNMNGLHRISGNQVTPFPMEEGGPYKLIYSICRDRKGRLWIGTARGCFMFDGESFQSFNMEDGLNSNVCQFILPDRRGDIWIGTPLGLNRLDGRTLRIYSIGNPRISSQLNQGAGYIDRQGNIWCGATEGVIRFNPASVRRDFPPPPVYISRWKVQGKQYPLTPGIRFPFDRNFMEFSFAGVSFTQPEQLVYRYRLNAGKHAAQWMTTGSRSVSFAYLPPGAYRFEVVAYNNGVESTGPASISFTIRPPIHKTWWFRLGILLILGLFTVLGMAWRNKRLEEKVEMRERTRQLVIAQRMELLGFLAGGAVHDLKNLLTIIIGYSGRVAQNPGNKENNLGFIEKIQGAATTAVRLSKQILAFTRRQYVDRKPVNLGALLKDIIDTLKITIPTGIQTQLDLPEKNLVIRYPINPTHFQQVVMNLCINAINAMPGGGKIGIRLSVAPGGGVQLEVSDTGTGIEEKKIDKIFEPLYSSGELDEGTGLGLFVVKQIVDEYGGRIAVESRPGEGSRFRVHLPPG